MDAISLEVTPRDVLGKKVSVLRRSGTTPIHLYGKGVPSRALQGDTTTVARIVSQAGQNIPLYLKVNDTQGQDLVFVREVQRHPVTNQILHVDFYRVEATQRLRGEIPVVLTGDAPAVRVHRGILMQTLHTLVVECLPMDTPEKIDVDISNLEDLDQGIRVSDLATDPAITILTDPEELIVRINPPRVAEDGAAGQPGDAAGAPAGEAREESN